MKPKLYDEFGNSIQHKLPNPSDKLIDGSKVLSPEQRRKIIDTAAKYVNENSFYTLGRASMCLQFAILVKYMLDKEKVPSSVVEGQALYKSDTDNFKWEHCWVETDSGEIIDCNIDSVIYHPDSPESIQPYNFWGTSNKVPSDRIFSDKKYLTNDDLKRLEEQDGETAVWKDKIDKEI